ncbi:MAG: AsmA-like C-terminal domain-containing protein [Micropepsaceae bacterium]
MLRWIGHAVMAAGMVVSALTGAMALALAFGPVSLGPLAPVLMRAVSDSVAGYRMTATDALLVWSMEETRLVVRFVEPKLVNDDGIEIATANDIAVSFSLEALVSGNIAPRSLEILGPTATFTRLEDGTFDVGIRTESRRRDIKRVESADFDAAVFIDALLEPPPADGEDTYLSEIKLSNATLTFIDDMTGSLVKAPRGTLIVRRTATGLQATLDGRVSLPRGDWRFTADTNYDRNAPDIAVSATLVDADLDALSEAGPLFEAFAGVALPLSGQITATMDTEGRIKQADLAITAQAGHFEARTLSNVPFEVKYGIMQAHYDGAQDLFQLTRLDVDSDHLKGEVAGAFRLRRGEDGLTNGWNGELTIRNGYLETPVLFDGATPVDLLVMKADNDLVTDHLKIETLRLESQGSVFDITADIKGMAAEKPSLKMDGTISNLPAMRIGTLWPKGVAEGARDWIQENVFAGTITDGTIHADIPADALASGNVPDSAARIELNYGGVEMAYISEMPHLTGVKGKAIVLGNHFESRIEEGFVGPLKLSEGVVTIKDLNKRGEPANIDGRITGKASELLLLLDKEPLGYPSRFGLDPKSVGGDADIALSLVVPTWKALKVEQIVFDIGADLTDVSMNIAEGIGVSDGTAHFAVTGFGLKAEGSGLVAGVQANFAWEENFNPGPDRISTRIQADAVIDEALRVRLGVDPGPYLDGPAAIRVSMTGIGFDPVTASAEVTLDDASLSVPELGYAKAAGVPAKATAELTRVPEGYRAAPVRLVGEGIDAELDVLLGRDGSILSFNANRLVAGRNDVEFKVDLKGGKPHVTANARSIDLDTLMDALLQPSESVVVDQAQATVGQSPSKPPHLSMSVRADRVLMRGGVEARDLQFDVDLDHGDLVALLLYGKLGDGEMLARLWPQQDGRRRIVAELTDMGVFIDGLSSFGSLKGGYGKMDVMLPRRGSNADALGNFAMRDFKLVDQPFIVRLLSAGSFQGLLELLCGTGISFDTLTADLAMQGDRLIARNLEMKGSAIGMTADGYFDRETEAIEASAVLTPIYSLNTLFAGVPLIGPLLGGENGILAVAFKIDGTVDALDIGVSYLSPVAPGILRKPFEYDSPVAEPEG